MVRSVGNVHEGQSDHPDDVDGRGIEDGVEKDVVGVDSDDEGKGDGIKSEDVQEGFLPTYQHKQVGEEEDYSGEAGADEGGVNEGDIPIWVEDVYYFGSEH